MTDLNDNVFLDIDPDSNMYPNVNFDVNTADSLVTSNEYLTVQQYSDSFEMDKFDITMINYNTRSFHQNGQMFESFLSTNPFSHDIIILSETWNKSSNVQLCKIDGYNSFHSYRESRSGGVSVFSKNNYPCTQISYLSEVSENIEICVVAVNIRGFLIINIPPTRWYH